MLINLIASCSISIAQDQTRKEPYVHFSQIQNSYYRNFVSPVTYNESCKVYFKPDTASEIITTLKFKTYLQLLREGEQEFPADGKGGLRILKWYEIDYENNKGFIKAASIATHSFYNLTTKCDYFLVTDFSAENNPDTNSFTIYKYDNNSKKFTDTLSYKNFRADVVHEIRYDGWKNVTMLFHAEEINAYCGGGTSDVFITDANNNLSEMISTKFNADDGSADSYTSTVWLPIKFMKGNILLLLNGDVENAFDANSGKLNTHAFPKELTIPKIELVVFNEIKTGSIYNKKGEPIKNADGNYTSKVVNNRTKYYKWDGSKLILIK